MIIRAIRSEYSMLERMYYQCSHLLAIGDIRLIWKNVNFYKHQNLSCVYFKCELLVHYREIPYIDRSYK